LNYERIFTKLMEKENAKCTPESRIQHSQQRSTQNWRLIPDFLHREFKWGPSAIRNWNQREI
jgi:hypothetical protein